MTVAIAIMIAMAVDILPTVMDEVYLSQKINHLNFICMKKLLLILLIFPLFASNTEKVYVCTGNTSARYHNISDCKGLKACKGTIEFVSLNAAKSKGKTPCGFCYPTNDTPPKIDTPLKHGEVYICTGSNSKRYHFSAECKGLQACRNEIKIISIGYAKQLQRTPCSFCNSQQKE